MTYPLGALVPLTWTGASTVATLTITLPDGSTTAPSVAGSAGAWTASYTPTQVGRHLIRWTGTSPTAAAPLDVVEVTAATGPTAAPINSLKDLRDHLGWNAAAKGTGDDAELLDIARSAADVLESDQGVGRPIRRRTVVETHADVRGVGLPLWEIPCPCRVCQPGRVLTLTALTVAGTALNVATDVELDPATGIVYRGSIKAPALGWLPPVVPTYVTGYSASPAWAALAEKRLVEHLWTRSQQARHSRNGAMPSEAAPAASYLLPYAVESLIAPHRGGI